jgi:hypothetical protein
MFIMSAIYMLENFGAVNNSCFGPEYQIVICITEWVQHMLKHRQLYMSLQSRTEDGSFLNQVLFAIDHASQIFIRSCTDNTNRSNVNDNILMMRADMNLINRGTTSLTFSQSS